SNVRLPKSAPPWNMKPKGGGASPASARSASGSPGASMRPAIGACNPTTWRSTVDLPLPLPPSTTKISPRRTSKSTCSRMDCPPHPTARSRTTSSGSSGTRVPEGGVLSVSASAAGTSETPHLEQHGQQRVEHDEQEQRGDHRA